MVSAQASQSDIREMGFHVGGHLADAKEITDQRILNHKKKT